jgi:hypothetical protein
VAEPVAYLIEGFDGGGKLYAKIVQFTVDEARNSAAEFARHYTTVTTTPLIRGTAGVQACVPALPDPDVQDESGLLTYYSKDALAEYAQAWRDAYGVLAVDGQTQDPTATDGSTKP